jgi:hypothetical protein
MKKNTVKTYTETLSVRLAPPEAQRVFQMAAAGHRTVSQTLRILLESILKKPPPPQTV